MYNTYTLKNGLRIVTEKNRTLKFYQCWSNGSEWF